MIKKIAMASAALSLTVSGVAFAEAVKPAPLAKVVQVKRARAAADPRKAQNVVGGLGALPLITVTVITVGVGVAAAAGLVTTSP